MRALIVATAVALVGAPSAGASCVVSPQKQEAAADAVFVARVISFNAERGNAKVKVLRVRKGSIAPGAVLVVRARPWRSSVTINFRPRRGERWRIGAQQRQARWITNDCLGTRRLR